MGKKIVLDLEAKVDKAVAGVEQLNDSVKDLQKDGKKASDQLQKGVSAVGESAKKSEKGVSGLAKGFKGVGIAIKAAGIGLVISLLGTLKDVFESNQAVADVFATTFETVSLVFNQFATAIIDTYTSISKASENFDALGKVVKGMMTIAITPLKLAFYAISLGIQEAQLAWEDSFLGGGDKKKIAALQVSILETKNALLEVGSEAIEAGKDIVTNVVEAAGEIVSITKVAGENLSKISITAAIESAKTNVQLKKSAELAAVANQGLIEQYDRQAEKLRQIRDDDLQSISDRKKANDELGVVLEEQEKAMLKNVDAILASAQAEFNKNSNQENTIALLEAQNEKTGVLAQIEGFRSEQISNRIALEKEALELTSAKSEAESNLAIEQKRFNAEQIEDEVSRLEALRLVLEEEQVLELARLQEKINNTAVGTQARLDSEIEFKEKKQEIDNSLFENERAIEEARRKQKEDTLNKLISLAGAESALGKAALLAKQLIAAQELLIDLGFIKSKAQKAIIAANLEAGKSGAAVAGGFAQTLSLGFPAAIPALVGYAATAVGIVSAIKGAVSSSKKVAASVGGSGGGSSPSIAAPSVQAPSFNIVGSSGSNQLAEAIGSQTQAPIKAFVVSSDVTTAQSLDRNIVSGASLG